MVKSKELEEAIKEFKNDFTPGLIYSMLAVVSEFGANENPKGFLLFLAQNQKLVLPFMAAAATFMAERLEEVKDQIEATREFN